MPKCDSVTDCQCNIAWEHHEIHDGDSYTAEYSVSSIGALAAPADTMQLHFTTGANYDIHILFQVSLQGSGTGLWKIVEAPTGGLDNPDGTITAYNRNRQSTRPHNIGTISYNGDTATGGLTLRSEYIGNVNTAAGKHRELSEWVLKRSTIYAFNLYCTSNIPASIRIDWYELD